MKRILVTGAAGFCGRYMCAYLAGLEQDMYLTGADIFESSNTCCNDFVICNLACAKDVRTLIKKACPDYIIHLAGTFGIDDVEKIYTTNTLSVAAILEAARMEVPEAILIITGSAAEYGCITKKQLPVDEQTDCTPVTHYGLSKYFSTQLTNYYHRVYDMCVMIVRPFQLIGKGINEKLVPGAFAEQLRVAITKDVKVIKVGNLESSRDFLDIHDAVEAIWDLCKKPAPGQIFNLCSGKSTKIAELLLEMICTCGADVKVEYSPSCSKGDLDISDVYGSYKKIKSHCGWAPKVSLQKSISDMFT